MIRIAVGGLMHESNTFAAATTILEDFRSGGLETGGAIADRWGSAHHEVGGFFEAARILGFEAVPTLMAWATPGGVVRRDCYDELVGGLIDRLRAIGRVDAVLLALHGAMVVENLEDADGTTLSSVRALIGPDCPLIASLDYHANVSPQMAEAADALVAYRTYPHVDQRARGRKAAEIAYRAACREIRPTMALRKPPLLIHLLAQDSSREPMASLLAELDRLEVDPRLIDASILAGFPYADTAATGPSCLVVADNDADLAESLATRLESDLWAARESLTATLPDAPTAVRQALAERNRPVLLIDLGDNIGGGAAGDSTVLAHELVAQGATEALLVIHDPDAAAACASAGIGADVSIHVGGRVDRNGPPLHVRGRITVIHDGRYVEDQPRHGGIRLNDQGLTVVVEDADRSHIVINSLRHPPFSLGQLTSLGLNPRESRLIVVKAAVAYRAAYGPIAGAILEVDTPGLTASNPARYTYRKLRRPILPLDPTVSLEVSRA